MHAAVGLYAAAMACVKVRPKDVVADELEQAHRALEGILVVLVPGSPVH
jgi:hypothetical protein